MDPKRSNVMGGYMDDDDNVPMGPGADAQPLPLPCDDDNPQPPRSYRQPQRNPFNPDRIDFDRRSPEREEAWHDEEEWD